MNKTFQYPSQRKLFSITIPTVLAACVTVYLLMEFVLGSSTALTLPLMALSLLIFLDHFVALSHPEQVTISDKSIEFACFGRNHHYTFDQIQRINIRKMTFTKNIYVRINNAGLLKGRYWLQIETLSDGQELEAFIQKLIEMKHPMMKNFDRRSFVRTK